MSELVFNNGYHFHPLCVCCSKSTLSIGVGNEQALQGMTLQAFGWGECGYGDDHPGLVMEFARNGDPDDVETIPMHFDSVRSLQKVISDNKRLPA